MTINQSAAPVELGLTALSCLLATLNEAQQTIRAYDTKAQIMGVGFIFAIAMVSRLLEHLPIDREFGLFHLLTGFVLLIGPVALFGAVLYPSRRTAQTNASDARGCFYYVGVGAKDLDAYVRDVEGADWKLELAHEIGRLSALRDLKRKRFLVAMFTAGVSFALILLNPTLNLAGIT